MPPEDIVKQFPTRRIKPFDGMAVTAEVWDTAHDYHRQSQRLHAMLSHGAGVLAGLKVVANDPANSAIFILPGVALDASGETIIMTEPITYDIGNRMSGLLHILLTYGESTAQAGGSDGGGLRYVQAQYGIEVQPKLPTTPHVELARVYRQSATSPVMDAKNPAYPKLNELDLRFRRELALTTPASASVALCYAGQGTASTLPGLTNLARTLKNSPRVHMNVDDDVSLKLNLSAYTLVYLAGRGDARVSPDEMNTLYQYIQGGGTLFIESLRSDASSKPQQADAALLDMLTSFGFKLGALPPNHALLTEPHLFSAPPAGFETQGTPTLQLNEGLIFSTYDYGSLWQGKRRSGVPTREEIRAALEWGENLIAYAVMRQRARKS